MKLLQVGKRGFRRKKLVDDAGHFRAVGCLELLHDISDMNLYRALPKLQLISDDLVGLAAPQGIDHFGLALREHAARG